MPDLESIANSTVTQVITRGIIILLPVLLTAMGWLVTDKLDTITATHKSMWQTIKEGNVTLSKIQLDVVSAKSDMQNHQRDDDKFDSRIESVLADHETRLRSLQLQPWPAAPRHN